MSSESQRDHLGLATRDFSSRDISRIYKARAAPQIYKEFGVVRISIAFIADAAGLAARLQDCGHTLGLRC